MKKQLINLIFSSVATAFAIAAVVFGAINMAVNNNSLNISNTQMSLASAVLLAAVIYFVLTILSFKNVKSNSLLFLIPTVANVILGLFAMSNVFVQGQANNYVVLLIFLIVVFAVTLIVNQIKDFKWASVAATATSSVLLIFYLYDALAYFTLFDNIFLCLTAFALLFFYVATIAYTAVNIMPEEEKEAAEAEEVEESKEEVANEETATEVTSNNEEVKEDTNSNEEVSNDTKAKSLEETKEEDKKENPYDNSFMYDDKI